MGEIRNTHIKIGEQNIDKSKFDRIALKGSMIYPALVLRTEGKLGRHSLNALRNSIDFNNGDSYIYIEYEGKLRCIGKIDIHIDNLFKIENLLRRLKPKLEYKEKEEDEYKTIGYEDYIHTIQI